MPSVSTYKKFFGSLTIALMEAGFDVTSKIDLTNIDPYAAIWESKRKEQLEKDVLIRKIKKMKQETLCGKWVLKKIPDSKKPKINGHLTGMVVGKE